jgi:uncharacterized protein (DUF2141 family)
VIRAALLLLIVAFPPRVAAQVRDRASTGGTASIAGRVMSDTEPPRPLRRVVVTAGSADRTVSRTAVTDDQGRFSIGGLPAGRYTLNATKRGWVSTAYGARAPGRPGRSIAVADGERATATLRLLRGAVITGVVLDHTGSPPQGVTVRVMRYAYAFNTGEKRLVSAGATSWGPDDRGVYRVYGLAPGEYYLAAVGGPGLLFQTQGVHLTSDVDVQQALKPAPAGPDAPERTVAFAPTFYPGTASPAQATPITVRAGEERTGIDFTVQYVPSSTISGTVVGPDPLPQTSAPILVTLFATSTASADLGFSGLRSARTGSDGKFSFADVIPGSYTIAARYTLPRPPDPNAPPPQILSATAQIDLQGEDVRGLTLQLQEGLIVSGTIRVDGSAPPPPLRGLRAMLVPIAAADTVSIASGGATVSSDGRFTVTGVTPGRYRLTMNPPAPWIAHSSIVGGQESLDTGVDIRASVTDAVITLTDRAGELTGRVQDAAGNAADYTLILFPVNREFWTPQSRRIQTTRTSLDGSFSLRNLAAGEYHLAAVDDVEQNEWFDPSFLQRIAASARSVTIGEAEKKVQDIRIGGGA